MTLPTWEIVIITVIAITVCAAAIYVFIRCWDSIKALSKDTSAPQRSMVTRQTTSRATAQTNTQLRTRPGIDVPEIYGVPYSAPVEPTKELDPAKLENLVMGKSDLHPYYLEKRDPVIMEEEDTVDGSRRDHRVTWCDDEILIESEFLPSRTEVRRDPSLTSSLSGSGSSSSPRPKRKVHISYDRGMDGSPEIKSITTEESLEEPPSPRSESKGDSSVCQSDHVDVTHVVIGDKPDAEVNKTDKQANISHRENWVDFGRSEEI